MLSASSHASCLQVLCHTDVETLTICPLHVVEDKVSQLHGAPLLGDALSLAALPDPFLAHLLEEAIPAVLCRMQGSKCLRHIGYLRRGKDISKLACLLR